MIDFIGTLLVYVAGTTLSLIVTGLLFDRFVLKRVMRNKEVQETLEVLREGRQLLKEILEEQKRKRTG